MSDPMRPPMAPPGAPQGGPRGPMQQMGRPQGQPQMGSPRESMMNSNDMAKKLSTGEVSLDMTIRDFYAQMGLDVDRNTLKDLAGAMRQQAQNATPAGKLRGAAGQGGVAAAAAPGQPPQSGGMAGLMSRMGGSAPTNGSRI